jgi:hypothetical protein
VEAVVGSPDRIDIGSVVTDEYLLDFLVLYGSLLESWTCYPFMLHAFVVGDGVAERLAALGLEDLEIHRLSGAAGDWRQNAARTVELVEQSGLERCIVADADSVFLSEIPELSFLLADHDVVLVPGPSADRPIQASLWSFRRNERSIDFARRWRALLTDADLPGSSRLLLDLVDDGNLDAIKMPRPFCVDADLEPVFLHQDQLGFLEERTGRVKVVHLAGLRGRGHRSLADRIDAVVGCFPQIAPLMSFYVGLAVRAAARLGLEGVPSPEGYARDRLLEAGILARRNQLPELLNRRRLDGTGAEVGVKRGVFSEVILQSWRGRTLISIDPWLEVSPSEYVDVSNVPQAQHERFYEETVKRLEQYGQRSVIWRMTSAEAAARVEPESLDFVYLDARHDYRSVKEDLEHWFDKIRPGGVFAGHDYLDGARPEGLYGVKSAVDEFFGARGLPVRSTYVDARFRAGPPPSWLVEIPAQGTRPRARKGPAR